MSDEELGEGVRDDETFGRLVSDAQKAKSVPGREVPGYVKDPNFYFTAFPAISIDLGIFESEIGGACANDYLIAGITAKMIKRKGN